jgi:hypothetical protein
MILGVLAEAAPRRFGWAGVCLAYCFGLGVRERTLKLDLRLGGIAAEVGRGGIDEDHIAG